MNSGIDGGRRIEIKRKMVGEELEGFLAALEKNDNYCLYKIDHVPENKCMCKDFQEQEEGSCHCGLYVKIKGGL